MNKIKKPNKIKKTEICRTREALKQAGITINKCRYCIYGKHCKRSDEYDKRKILFKGV